MERARRATQVIPAVFAFLAVLMTAVIVFALGEHQGVQRANDERMAQAQHENARAAALRQCQAINATAQSDCLIAAIERAQERKDSRQDLYAQQRMVSLAFWSLVVAASGLAVTAIGVWLVKETLDATRDAVADTAKATNAVLEANNIARKIGEAQVNCYLSFSEMQLVFPASNLRVPVFSGYVANTGQTPASLLHVQTRVKWYSHYVPDIGREQTDRSGVGLYVGELRSQGREPFNHLINQSMFLNDAELVAVKNKKLQAEIRVDYYYMNVFGVEQHDWFLASGVGIQRGSDGTVCIQLEMLPLYPGNKRDWARA